MTTGLYHYAQMRTADGCQEIWNVQRASTYARNGAKPPGSVAHPCACEGLDVLCDESYHTAALDLAWWLDPNNPRSLKYGSQVAGFIPESIVGAEDATWTRVTQESANGGATFSAPRPEARIIRVKGNIVAATCCAASEFRRQFTASLLQLCNCDGVELRFPDCCPSDDVACCFDYSADIDVRWLTMRNVAMVRPPTLTGKWDGAGCGSCGAGAIQHIEFTLVAGDPLFYQDPQIIWEGGTFNDDQVECQILNNLGSCCPQVKQVNEYAKEACPIQLRPDRTWCPIGFDPATRDPNTCYLTVGLAVDADPDCKPYQIRVRYDATYDGGIGAPTWEPVNPGRWPADGSIPTDCSIVVAEVQEWNPLAADSPYTVDCKPYYVDMEWDGTDLTWSPVNPGRWEVHPGTDCDWVIPCDCQILVREYTYPNPDYDAADPNSEPTLTEQATADGECFTMRLGCSTDEVFTFAWEPEEPGAAPGGSACLYTVVLNDNLSTIASQHPGVSAQDIANANGITNINLIYPGQVLTIPGCAGVNGSSPVNTQQNPTGAVSCTYVVQGGDTLIGVANYYGTLGVTVTYVEIAAANGILPPYIIQPGQSLTIPNCTDDPGTPGTPPAVTPDLGVGFPVPGQLVILPPADCGSENSLVGWATLTPAGEECFDITLNEDRSWVTKGWDLADFVPQGGTITVASPFVDTSCAATGECPIIVHDDGNWDPDGWTFTGTWPEGCEPVIANEEPGFYTIDEWVDDPTCDSCDPGICVDDQGCAPFTMPERAIEFDSCAQTFCPPWATITRCEKIDTSFLQNYEVADVVLRLHAGAADMCNLTIKVWPNPLDLDPEDLTPCSAETVEVARVRAGETLCFPECTILCADGSERSALGAINGSLPRLDCTPHVICVTADAFNIATAPAINPAVMDLYIAPVALV